MEQKRPLIISIFCVLGFIGFVFVAGGLLMPSVQQTLSQQYGTSYLVVTALLGILGLAGLIGMWKMRKWGVYTYTAMTVLSIGYGLTIGLQTGVVSYIIPAIIVVTGFVYLKRMR